MKRIRLLFTLTALLTVCSMPVSHAQLGKKLLKTVGQSAEKTTLRKAEQKTEQAVGNTIDKTTDPNSYKGDKSEKGQNEQIAPQNASGDDVSASSQGKQTQSTLESYSQYDFVPGDRILFFEDFSQDEVGDFPALWTTNTAGEIKTLNNFSGKWFHMTAGGTFTCLTKIDLPANFIIEFDYIPYFNDEVRKDNPNRVNWYAAAIMRLYNDKEDKFKELDTGLYPGAMGVVLWFSNNGWAGRGYNSNLRGDDGWGQESTSKRNVMKSEQINHIIVWVQNRRVRIYHDGAKVLDGPTLLVPETKFSRILFANDDSYNRPFFSNIKITTAGSDTRSKLLTDGKLISYGIYFDVNKDVVKPESYGALNDIAKVLKENADVRVRIVGHTDSDGDDAANLDLSKRRAASVKDALTKTFGIDASRMETDGKGASEPLTSNGTSAEKARNRRVEFIKL